MKNFVHLHVHTQYSLLQGAIHVDALFDRVKELGMTAVAMTDMHNMFGAIDFYLQAKKSGIKPILGCEVHFIPEKTSDLAEQQQSVFKPRSYHLVILCKSLKGYHNLCEMLSESYLRYQKIILNPGINKQTQAKSFAYVDRELLDRFGDELVILSGCLRGEIPYLLATGETSQAMDSMKWFRDRFKENFYIELQDSSLSDQEELNDQLYDLAKKLNIPCVVTTDCHYLHSGDAEAHEVLQCIEHGKNLDIDRPKSLVPSQYYVKSGEEMAEHFSRFPDALENTDKIADICNVEFVFKDPDGKPIYHLPKFRPEGVSKEEAFDDVAYFIDQSREGLKKRFIERTFKRKVDRPDWQSLEKEYWKRLDDELQMIVKTGFSGYFLIVADFIQWAKNQKIPVGPGRGSGAGSLVAYALQITDIDPLEFNLLFERFINPERISMPDFDVDFCQDRRGEVIEYVARKYGEANVCQIITYGKLQTRAVLKDVGRVLGLNFQEADQLNKLIPDELNISIDEAIAKEPRLRERMEQDFRIAKVVEYARKLEGLYRNAGMHAAGVIITEKPITQYCPIYVGKDGAVVTQFDKDSAEKIGLIKYDFLGLKTLTVIDQAVKLIQQSQNQEFGLDQIDYFDSKVFELISSADTNGVFQVESSGMKDLCSRLQPSSLEDITAINALYRPGPIGSGMLDDFIERKHGRKAMEYEVPALEPILKDTYGVILYQEQVMQIARELAGYSLGQADLLRRAMGKKKADEMAAQKELFLKGAIERKLDPVKANSIFDLMAKFAEYGFNKSHSAAYGILTYQTAYLKTYYPAEFMAALMTTEIHDTDKITKYIADAKAHKIAILSPDVNYSQQKFSVEKQKDGAQAIRFGLEGIKGVGGMAVLSILESRKLEGPFKNMIDFAKRVSARKVNKKVMEALTMAGAFDSIAEVNRASLFSSLEALLDYGSDEQAERELGQTSLFDSFQSDEIKLSIPMDRLFKQETDWPQSRKLLLEKQVVGFFVSGHPLDQWQHICDEWLGWNTEKITQFFKDKKENAPAVEEPSERKDWRNRPTKPEVKLCGLVSEMREVMTKKSSRMAFGMVEDLYGKLECVIFPEAYAKLGDMISQATAQAEAVIVVAELELASDLPKLLVKELLWVKDAHQNRVQNVVIRLNTQGISEEHLRALKKQLIQHRGRCPVKIEFVGDQFKTELKLPEGTGLSGTPQMVAAINQIFNAQVVHLV